MASGKAKEKPRHENLIHLRFEHSEALKSKKDILQSQESMMVTAKLMSNYHILRKGELKERGKFHRKLTELLTTIKKLQKNMPEVEMPDILKHRAETEQPEIKERKKTKKKENIRKKISKDKEKEKKDLDIDSQLKEIQRKLKQLQK